MPKRVQRTRFRGAAGIPPGAIYVGRPGIFGNPWRAANAGTAKQPLWIVGGPSAIPRLTDETSREAAHQLAVEIYRRWLNGSPIIVFRPAVVGPMAHRRERILTNLPNLRGYDLACWCGPEYACHATVLLELSNV